MEKSKTVTLEYNGKKRKFKRCMEEVYLDVKTGRVLLNGTGGICKDPRQIKTTSIKNKSEFNVTGATAWATLKYKSADDLGNHIKRFFRNHKAKREKIYSRKGDLIEEIEPPIFLEDLLVHLHVTRVTWNSWRRGKNKMVDYQHVVDWAVHLINGHNMKLATLNKINERFTWNVLKNSDSENYKDRIDVEHKLASDVNVSFVTINTAEELKSLKNSQKKLEEGGNGFQGEIVDAKVIEEGVTDESE